MRARASGTSLVRVAVSAAIPPERVVNYSGSSRLGSQLQVVSPLNLLGKGAAVALICLLLLGATAAVYLTGGTRYAMLHCFYIPVIVAGCLLGITGGALTGFAAGLLLGPLMPLNVVTGEMQVAANWLVRLSFLATAGIVTGSIVRLIRKQHDAMQQFAFRSASTELPNRLALVKEIDVLTADPEQRGRYTLALVRINNFDHIINALGTGLIERLIRALAERLAELQPEHGLVYDLRAHKLALVLPVGGGGIEAYVERAHRIPDEPISVDGIPIFVDLAIGTVVIDGPVSSAELLIQRANIALYEARQTGQFNLAYRPEGEAARRRNQELLAELPAAIRQSELFLEYQPKLDLARGTTLGVEALVRWQHPRLGLIPPVDFIGPAEETGLMHPLTRWIVRAAIRDIAELRQRTGYDQGVAINLSPRNLSDPELFAHLFDTLAEFELPAERVELEITESAILHGSARIHDQLADIRQRGVKVAIDDFGTGFTSLRHLAELSVDCLKIDRMFVQGVLSDERRRHIVRGVVRLATDLGLATVAEGIEDLKTAEALVEMGCTIGQGFVFCRPLPPNKLAEWLASR